MQNAENGSDPFSTFARNWHDVKLDANADVEHFHGSLEYVTQLLHTWDSTPNVLMSKYVLRFDDHEPDNWTVLVANDNQESSNNNNFLNISRTVS